MPAPLRVLAATASLALIAWGLVTSDEVSDARWLGVLGLAWLLLLVATHLPLRDMPPLSRSLVRTALVFATVLAIVSVQLIRIQVIQQDAIVYRSASTADGDALANPRVVLSPLETARGEIVDRDGEIIAETIQNGDRYLRSWPNPTTSYVAGYHSPFLFGSSGLELSHADVLTGQAGNNPVSRLWNDLLHRPQQGSDLALTLDTDLQESAHAMLGGQNGAVVVVEIETGDVVVLASNPTYDPNALFTASPSGNPDARAAWDDLLADPDTPFVTRATLGLYTPGSTFKTVTAAIGIDLGYTDIDREYEDDGEIEIDGRVLVENNRPDESRSEWTLREGIMWSLNVVLAQVGLQIGGGEFWDAAQRFGFGNAVPFDLPTSRSTLASSEGFLDSSNAIADTAFGQGEIQVTPLHMALITAGFANDGEIMRPRLVDRVIAPDGDVVQTMPTEMWLEPVSPETAADIERSMIDTVESGSAGLAQVPGYSIGGKTGTAETSAGEPHSWFIAFIGPDGGEPQYAVTVVLEQGQAGLPTAIAIARDILVQTIEAAPPSG